MMNGLDFLNERRTARNINIKYCMIEIMTGELPVDIVRKISRIRKNNFRARIKELEALFKSRPKIECLDNCEKGSTVYGVELDIEMSWSEPWKSVFGGYRRLRLAKMFPADLCVGEYVRCLHNSYDYGRYTYRHDLSTESAEWVLEEDWEARDEQIVGSSPYFDPDPGYMYKRLATEYADDRTKACEPIIRNHWELMRSA